MSCRHHAFRQHRIESSSPIVAAIDACAHRWTTPTRVTNFSRIICVIERGIERSRARPSRECIVVERVRERPEQTKCRAHDRAAAHRRDRAYLGARARTRSINTSPLVLTVDRRRSSVVVAHAHARRPTLPPHDTTFRSFKCVRVDTSHRRPTTDDRARADTFAIFTPVSRETPRG